MNIYFIGSGSECNYQYPRRKNTSLLFEFPKGNLLVDVGDAFPDNWNLLKRKYKGLKFPSVLFFSHGHIDHACSFAAYRHYSKKEESRYGTLLSKNTLRKIRKMFHWLGNSDFKIISFLENSKEVDCLGQKIMPFELEHGSIGSTGFRVASLSFVPDFNGNISNKCLKVIEGSKTIIMECNNIEKKLSSHNNFKNAMKLGKTFKKLWSFEHLILTHLGDDFPANKDECQKFVLQQNKKNDFKVSFSFDLMKIKI